MKFYQQNDISILKTKTRCFSVDIVSGNEDDTFLYVHVCIDNKPKL